MLTSCSRYLLTPPLSLSVLGTVKPLKRNWKTLAVEYHFLDSPTQRCNQNFLYVWTCTALPFSLKLIRLTSFTTLVWHAKLIFKPYKRQLLTIFVQFDR